MSTREIPLSRGRAAIVDAADYDSLARWTWHAGGRNDGLGFYAMRSWPTPVLMHRLLLPDAIEVDHINGDGLDNRRANLRPATRSQNACNRRGPTAVNTSGYLGVFRQGGRWRGQVRMQGQNYHAGYFATAEAAARARDALARELHGEFASLNFPAEEVASDA